MEELQNNQVTGFESGGVLRSMMKSHTALWGFQMRHLLVQLIHAADTAAHQSSQDLVRRLVARNPSAYVQIHLTAPRYKSSDADNLDTPKKSHQVTPLGAKVKVL